MSTIKLLVWNQRVGLLYFMLFITISPVFSEGTKQLDPSSTDLTMLMTNNAAYGTFGIYDGPLSTRLHIHIADPENEQVYLGFSQMDNGSGAAWAGLDYYFRIKDPSGNVVYGPVLVDASTANTDTWALAAAGPQPIVGAGGYSPFTFDPSGGLAGDYYVEFSDNANSLSTVVFDVRHFDITVATTDPSPQAIDGRIWSYNWDFKTPTITGTGTYGNFDRAFNGQIYAYTANGFVNKIDFLNSGFRGWFFSLAFNDTGTGNTGNIAEDRKSVDGSNSNLPKYQIFFNDPDINEFPSGTVGSVDQFSYVYGCDLSNLCVTAEVTEEGQVEILLDFDATTGMGVYDPGTADVLLTTTVTARTKEVAPYRRCLEWDGLDGLGASVNLGQTVPTYVYFSQGVVHYGAYDVEYNPSGYTITQIRPNPLPGFTQYLYYDDSNILDLPGNGASATAYDGCTPACHGWTNFNYGNENTINTWWFSNQDNKNTIEVPACPPFAADDSTGTAMGIPVQVVILNNDGGTSLDLSSIAITSAPSNGTVTINYTTGELEYTPNTGFYGTEIFWYEICNSDATPLCADAMVQVTVNGIDAVNDDNNTLKNLGISGNILTNDRDADGHTIMLTTTPIENPKNGMVSISTDGTYTYTPDPGYVGKDQFKYRICDDGTPVACDTAVVTITVTDTPSFFNDEVIANDDEIRTYIDVAITGVVSTNDSDVDGDPLTVNTTPISDPIHGSLILNADGSYTYTPSSGFAGRDEFQYQICDNSSPQFCATANVYIDVVPDLNGAANNPPFASDDFALTQLDTDINGNVSTNDPVIGLVTTTPISSPTHGGLTLNADGSYTYSPTTSYNGPDQFVYETCVAGSQTVLTNHASTDIPVSIPLTTGPVTSTMTVPSTGYDEIADVNVNLDITHTWVSDLIIDVIAPDGTTLTMISRTCGQHVDMELTLDDEALNDYIAIPCPPVGGASYKPLTNLSFFDGKSAAGTWSLRVTDMASGDAGSIDGWSLDITTYAPECVNATAYILVLPAPIQDTDGDGITDNEDIDDDNDGVPDAAEACLGAMDFSCLNTILHDGSNNALDPTGDEDGDGILNYRDADDPGVTHANCTDSNNDDICDTIATELDSDGDGIPNFADLDADNDGLPDLIEAGGTDIDGNGLVDQTTDSDGDGLVDVFDNDETDGPSGSAPCTSQPVCLLTNSTSTLFDSNGDGSNDRNTDWDTDGQPDFMDLDSDNDGIPDLIESGGVDTDGNGMVDNVLDGDIDGFVDIYDPSNSILPGTREGTPMMITGADSGDGTASTMCSNCSSDPDAYPDHLDLDADNDGLPDIIEAGGIDVNGDGQVDDLTDSDNDGLVDSYDPENRVNTGVNEGTAHFVTGTDSGDGTPTTFCTDCDSDKDGLADHLDLDADGDGIPDIVEAGGIDADGDGLTDVVADADNDGYADIYDSDDNTLVGSDDGGTPLVETNGGGDLLDGSSGSSLDSDNDGLADHLDLDADNDGIPDIVEAGGIDADGDGRPDVQTDSDNDGLIDYFDSDDHSMAGIGDGGTPLVMTTADSNADGQISAGDSMTDGSGASLDFDGDSIADHLDLDSDNDGLPDLIEARGVDPEGDGRIDDAALPWDIDGDGFADIYDTNNDNTAGTNDGGNALVLTTADSDNDGLAASANEGMTVTSGGNLVDIDGDDHPNHLDLDADNDGIVDVVEAGGSDADGNGLLDGSSYGSNGYNNTVDPADSNDPLVSSATDTGDANSRPEYSAGGATGAIADSDGDDVPNFLDIDSDNDGIYDNYEAQPTATYSAPGSGDADGDGILDQYDDNIGFGGSGIDGDGGTAVAELYDHDMDNTPDYLDTDADDDNILDAQEAWDHLADGDSVEDYVTGCDNEDTDGDGLIDCYDSDANDPAVYTWAGNPAQDNGSTDGGQTSSSGTVFSNSATLDHLLPDNGGNDTAEPDYRDQLVTCSSNKIYYAISERAGATLTDYEYNTSSGLHEDGASTGIIRATAFCEPDADGWYYFYNPLEPSQYLFAIKNSSGSPNTVSMHDLVNYIEIKVEANINNRSAIGGSQATLAMPRDWNVVFKGTPTAGSSFDIKFYFDPQELLAMDAQADLVEANSTNPVRSPIQWFKRPGGVSNSDIEESGISNITDLSSTVDVSLDGLDANGDGVVGLDGTVSSTGNNKNYVEFQGLTSFSGGTGSIGIVYSALPVELTDFSGEEDNCSKVIRWSTASEEGFDYFELERSKDAQSFDLIHVQASLGGSHSQAYQFVDKNADGLHYYRLRMVDKDGSIDYSEIIAISSDCGQGSHAAILYPNPVKQAGHLMLKLYAFQENIELIITDVQGKVFKRMNLGVDNGWNRIEMDVADLPKGAYFMKVIGKQDQSFLFAIY